MRRAVSAIVVVLSCSVASISAQSAEGRVADAAAVQPDQERVSNYVGGGTGRTAPGSAKTQREGVSHKNTRVAVTREKRPATIAQSHTASDFYIFDAASALLKDRDGDEYHSEFRIRFEADSTFGDALVYAKLYLRRVGEDDWLLYHTTDDFWIYGQSSEDDYFVTTTLDDGFPTSEYDVLIDLYETGFNGVVATLSSEDTGALSLLPLEEAGLDAPIEAPGFAIRDVITTLLIDDDADGHYSQFRIEFDPDADFAGAYVYIVLWVRAQGGEWIEEHVSEDFLVDASGTADVYSLTADWISGYPTAYYDVQIDLYDAASGRLAATAGSERPELSRIPLEDQSRDVRPNPPTSGGNPGDAISRERGGGALTCGWALALLLLLFFRARREPAR